MKFGWRYTRRQNIGVASSSFLVPILDDFHDWLRSQEYAFTTRRLYLSRSDTSSAISKSTTDDELSGKVWALRQRRLRMHHTRAATNSILALFRMRFSVSAMPIRPQTGPRSLKRKLFQKNGLQGSRAPQSSSAQVRERCVDTARRSDDPNMDAC